MYIPRKSRRNSHFAVWKLAQVRLIQYIASIKLSKIDAYIPKKCPYYQSSNILLLPIFKCQENGLRNNLQHYKCKCYEQFHHNPSKPSREVIWQEYLDAKQTTSQIASRYQISTSTIRRILAQKTSFGLNPIYPKWMVVCISMQPIGDAIADFFLPLMMLQESLSVFCGKR